MDSSLVLITEYIMNNHANKNTPHKNNDFALFSTVISKENFCPVLCVSVLQP